MTHTDFMFSFFKKKSVLDPALGELRRSGGAWRGSLSVDGLVSVPLVLPGNSEQPDPLAIDIVRQLDARLPAWRPEIARELFDHLEPYAQENEIEALRHINAPEDVWPHTKLSHVVVFQQGGDLTLELGYRVDWDEEHTLGARFQHGKLVELNGSTAPL